MDSSLIALMMLSLFLGCGCWLLFLWAVRDGQFSDIERAKYRMLDDDESIAPPPGGGRNVAHEETVGPLPDPPPPSLPAEALAKAEPVRRSLGEGGRGEGSRVK